MRDHRLFTPDGGEAEPVFRIGLAPIPAADWFEGGEADPAHRKCALLAANPTEVWRKTPGSRPAQAEAARLIAAWRGEPDPAPDAGPPLWAASLTVSDDLCLMERRDGAWTLTAASLCAPSFFTAKEAVGLALDGLHGPVPGFNATLLPRVARIFDALAADTILERRNWSIVTAPDLFLPSSAPLVAELATLTPAEIARRLVVRRERQTLRRLPDTGAVLFTIRIWREAVADLLADPDRRAALAAAWDRLMSAEGAAFRGYKRLHLLDAAVRHALAQPGPAAPSATGVPLA